MQQAFAALLRALMEERGIGNRELARRSSAEGTESGTSGYISAVLSGKKPPSLERAEQWADALRLEGDERRRYMDLAAVAHLPETAQSRFVDLLTRLDQADRIAEGLQAQIKTLERSIRLAEKALDRYDAGGDTPSE